MTFPKPTPRLKERVLQRTREDHAWMTCCRVVDARDRYRCRACHRRTRRTMTLCPERAEHHHLVPRSLLPKTLHADPRIIVLVCAACHGKLQRHELVAVGSTAWMVEGTPYLDASGEVRFVPAQSAI